MTSPLVELAARIERAPEVLVNANLGSAALDRLADWWMTISGSPSVNYRTLTLTAGSSHVPQHNADALIDSGANLVACATPGDDVLPRIIVGLYAGADVHQLLPQFLSDSDWMRSAESMRHELFALRDMRAEPVNVLHELKAALLEQRVGALLTCSARSTPYILQSLDDFAAALIADRLSHRAKTWWLAAGTSIDPAVAASIQRLGLEPVLDLGLSADTQVGSEAIRVLLELAVRA